MSYAAFNPPLASALGQAIMPSPATNLPFGVLDLAASFLQNINLQSAQASVRQRNSIASMIVLS